MKFRHPVLVAAALAIGAFGLAACADDDLTYTSGSNDARTVQIDMVDTAYQPGHFEAGMRIPVDIA